MNRHNPLCPKLQPVGDSDGKGVAVDWTHPSRSGALFPLPPPPPPPLPAIEPSHAPGSHPPPPEGALPFLYRCAGTCTRCGNGSAPFSYGVESGRNLAYFLGDDDGLARWVAFFRFDFDPEFFRDGDDGRPQSLQSL